MLTLGLHTHVRADSWEQPNTAGGKIVLTDRVCDDGKYPSLLSAYAYLPSGEVTLGCWGPLDAKVHVSWNDGQFSVFSMDVFVASPANKKKTIKKPSAPL